MADFCKQCSIEIFGEDHGDLKNLRPEVALKPGFGWPVICEGCGHTIVDNNGKCISKHCEKHNKVNAEPRIG